MGNPVSTAFAFASRISWLRYRSVASFTRLIPSVIPNRRKRRLKCAFTVRRFILSNLAISTLLQPCSKRSAICCWRGLRRTDSSVALEECNSEWFIELRSLVAAQHRWYLGGFVGATRFSRVTSIRFYGGRNPEEWSEVTVSLSRFDPITAGAHRNQPCFLHRRGCALLNRFMRSRNVVSVLNNAPNAKTGCHGLASTRHSTLTTALSYLW